MIEHLYCTSCDTCPTVAKIDGKGHLVCHCTHTDSPMDPFPLGSFGVIPMEWEFRTNQQPETPA